MSNFMNTQKNLGDNIKTDLRDTDCEDGSSMELSQDRAEERCWTFEFAAT
jgi:hypothetical protein